MSDTGDRTKDLFFELLDLDPDERTRYLDRASAGDAELRARVERLIAAHDDAGAFMSEPTSPDAGVFRAATPGPAPEAHTPEKPGDVIGNYTLSRLIGEGGFGSVYLAEQTRPVSRRVALKLVKLGMDTRQVVARFEAERQALAMMSHPHIARVFDAGMTGAGRPYFVMEYVDGEPITQFCDRKQFTVTERLELFREVCMAVQHAHQRGIIHRDIKPSNVLITVVDGKAQPKVIDFGIAKCMGRGLTEQTLITEDRQMIGTPEFMSPEQATLSASDVDTRTDVYGLGVLLYVLLCGAGPYDEGRLRSASFSELERIIREEQPPRPSQRIEQLADQREAFARARGVEPERLARAVRGEPDWIVLRAIEKDRARRYPTAYAFASDIERSLQNEPIEAGPPSRVYRARKFIRRHSVGVGVVALVAVLLIAGVAGTSWGLVRSMRANEQTNRLLVAAQNERENATEAQREAERRSTELRVLADFAQSILTGVDPAIAQGRDTELLMEVLRSAGDRAELELADSPEIHARIRNTIGHTFVQIGKYPEAAVEFQRALDVATDAFGPTHVDAMDARQNLLVARFQTGDLEGVSEMAGPLMADQQEVFGERHQESLRTERVVARVKMSEGDWEAAREIFERQLPILREELGPRDPDTLSAMNSLGVVYDNMGMRDEAIEIYEEVSAWQQELRGEKHPLTLATLNNLADVMMDDGRFEEALPILQRTYETKVEILGPEHPSTIIGGNNLASAYGQVGRTQEKIDLLLEIEAAAVRGLGEQDMRTLILRNNIAMEYAKSGDLARAEPMQERVVAGFEGLFGPDHPNTLRAGASLVGMRIDLGHYEEAYERITPLLPRADEVFGADSATAQAFQIHYARALIGLERYEEAEPILDRALELLEEDHGGQPARIDRAMRALAELYGATGRADEQRAMQARLDERGSDPPA